MQTVISWVRLHKSVQYARAAHVVQPASKSARHTPQCPLQPSQHVLTELPRTRISDYSDPSNYSQFNPHFDYQRAFIRGLVGQYLADFAVAQQWQCWPREKPTQQAAPDQPNKTTGLEHTKLSVAHKR